MVKEFKITVSKSGIPCLWECGGGYTKTGDATIVTGSHGEAKKAIYVRTHGHLACDDHALIPVKVGDYVINAGHEHGKDFVKIYKILDIDLHEEIAKTELIDDAPHFLDLAINTSLDKSYDYHCRTPYYCII